ncbi:MAG TPA: hypothetical protein VMV10_11620 [Pirellulales bacterium]|nr:hypothetical protein [Pirellulales bacterium]
MLSATLLTALVLAPGQLLKGVPIAESSTMRLHVGKQGRWTMTFEESAHTRLGGDDAATIKLAKKIGEEMSEEFSHGLASAEFTSEVKVVGENPATVVVTVTGKGDDPADLLQWLRLILGCERCAFSWNRERFEISGFPPKPQTSLVGSVLGVIISGVVFDPHYKAETVLTTDGRFVVDHLPCKIEDDGRRLVLDVSKLADSPEQERSLRIEGLGE